VGRILIPARIFVAISLVPFFTSFANQTHISLTGSYQIGECEFGFLNSDLYGDFQDTVIFSNGIALGSFFANPKSDSVSYKSAGILFLQRSLAQGGFRYSQGIQRREMVTGQIQAYDNPDTSWDLASVFPNSFYPFDTQISDSTTACGKWFFDRIFGTQYGQYIMDFPCDNQNAILYAKSNKNGQCMKCQLVSWSIAMGGVGVRIATGTMRWATDSAGNGVFPSTQARVTREISSIFSNVRCARKGLIINRSNAGFLNHSAQYVDVLGREIPMIRDGMRGKIGSSIIILNHNPSRK
jgi:hypothetical protein